MKRFINWILSLFKKTTMEQQKELPLWYQTAIKELGVHEIVGIEHNKRILEYHLTTTLKATNDETSWCSAFVCWCLEQNGIKSTRNALARSYLTWGRKVEIPYEGCIVVFKRGLEPWAGHVGFFCGYDGPYIKCLSGNQSNSVSIAKYLKADLLDFREPDISRV